MPTPATTPLPMSLLSYNGPPQWWTAACNAGLDAILAAHRQWASLVTLQGAPLTAFWGIWDGALAAKTAEPPIDPSVPMLPTPPIVEPLPLTAAAVAAAPSPIDAVEVAAVGDESEAVVEADELTRIVGIGPRLAAGLARQGVTTFAQIAAWTAEDLDRYDKALDLKGRALRDAWVAQARRFAEAAKA